MQCFESVDVKALENHQRIGRYVQFEIVFEIGEQKSKKLICTSNKCMLADLKAQRVASLRIRLSF